MNGLRINLLFAPTSCMVLMINLLEKILRRMELLINTTANTRNSNENPKIHFRILLRLLYTSTIKVLSFFTSMMPGTDFMTLIASSIFAGSTYSGFKATSIEDGKMFSSNNASLSIPILFFASAAAILLEM